MNQREAPQKFRGTGDREYMTDFTAGRETAACQSCGYDIRRPKDFGTTADGSPTDQYCCVCYRDGQFAHDATDIPNFLTKAAPDLARYWGGSVGKIKLTLRKQLPRLPRWQ